MPVRAKEGPMNNHFVSEVYKLHGGVSVSINVDSSAEEVIGSFVRQPSIRGIFLVDSKLRYVGMVSRIDLLRWSHIKLAGGKGRREITISNFFRIADARKAGDLTGSNLLTLSVKESDTLQTALDKMLDSEEDVIPVLDSEGRILGDLGLSEVLWAGFAYSKRTAQDK
jgi:CBS domain-containing protein